MPSSSSNSSSKPRPIHFTSRPIRDKPDDSEPSFSYEERVHYMQDDVIDGVDDVEDEFHRRLAGNTSRRDSSGTTTTSRQQGGSSSSGGGNTNQNISLLSKKDGGIGIGGIGGGGGTKGGGGTGGAGAGGASGGIGGAVNIGSVDASSTGGGSAGSFWRTSTMMDTTPILGGFRSSVGGLGGGGGGSSGPSPVPGGMMMSLNTGSDHGGNNDHQYGGGGGPHHHHGPLLSGGNKNFPLPIKEIAVRERKTSGGLLGAALQLHENPGGGGPGGTNSLEGRKFDTSRYRRQGSSNVSGKSNNSNVADVKQKQKEIAKARDTARKYKLEAQHSGTIEYGHDEVEPITGIRQPDYMIPLDGGTGGGRLSNQRQVSVGSTKSNDTTSSSVATSTSEGDYHGEDSSRSYTTGGSGGGSTTGPLPNYYKQRSSTGTTSGGGLLSSPLQHQQQHKQHHHHDRRSGSGGGDNVMANNKDILSTSERTSERTSGTSSLIFPTGPTGNITPPPSFGGGIGSVLGLSGGIIGTGSKAKDSHQSHQQAAAAAKAAAAIHKPMMKNISAGRRETSVGTVGSISIGSNSSANTGQHNNTSSGTSTGGQQQQNQNNNNQNNNTRQGSGGGSYNIMSNNPLTAAANSIAKSVATAPTVVMNAVIPSQLKNERDRDVLFNNNDTESLSESNNTKPTIRINKDGSLTTNDGVVGSSGSAATTSGGTSSVGGGGGGGGGGSSSARDTHSKDHHHGGGGGGGGGTTTNEPTKESSSKRNKINMLLDQCETVRFPFKKKLMLNNLNLTSNEIPVKDLYGTSLGNSLHKLSIAGNRLQVIPPKLVTCLPVLKTLDLSQCELHQLPERWNLPQLKRLNLSHNRLTDFPEETMLEGILELHELNMYGNKVSVIVVPHNPKVLSKLENLNLGYNDLAYIPEELDRLKSLRVLKVMNNFLEKIPMRVCDMELKSIDVSSNPVIQPPIETCERGIGSMKRYYHCLRQEEQNKQKALEALQNKGGGRSKSTGSKSSSGSSGGFMGKKKAAVDKLLNFGKPKRGTSQAKQAQQIQEPTITTKQKRNTSDESRGSNSKFAAVDPDERTTISTGSGVSFGSVGRAARSVSLDVPPPSSRSSSKTSGGGAVGFVAAAETKKERQKSAPAAVEESSLKRSASSPTPAVTDSSEQPSTTSSSISPKIGPPVTTMDDQQRKISDGSSSLTSSGPAVAPSAAFSLTVKDDAETVISTESRSAAAEYNEIIKDDVTVNDTLKVIFVGMAMAGKTSMIKRLIEGHDAVIPKRDERTVGVDIYNWDTKKDNRFKHIDCRIDLQDKELDELCGDVNAKFSVWDFAGQHVYHATHELFFSPRALYILVWDMGATNPATKQRKSAEYETAQGAFKLSYDSDEDSSDDDDFTAEEEARRADRALERDIDDKVQFWVDCIQTSAPGAAILPVATFDDLFSADNSQEAIRRCKILKQRLLKHEARRLQGIKDRLKEYNDSNRANDENAMRLRKLLSSYSRPKLIFGNGDKDAVVRVSGTRYTGFATLTERIINIATGRDTLGYRYPIFRGHLGARIPRMRLEIREAVRQMRDRFKVVEWGYFINILREEHGLMNVEDISDALHFLTNIGELSYFGGVLPDREAMMGSLGDQSNSFVKREPSKVASDDQSAVSYDDDDDDDDEEENGYYSMGGTTSLTMPTTEEGSLTTIGESGGGDLSQFVFLNPRWLVASVACILRHDLDREIQETRRRLEEGNRQLSSGDSFYEVNLNCPVITAEDACMLWQAKKFTKKAAERAQQYSNHGHLKPFEFLQLLLIKFGVFVPIDLGIEKALLGGFEYGKKFSDISDDGAEDAPTEEITVVKDVNLEDGPSLDTTFFFLPSLLGPGEPVEAWTYKSTDSWKATLCHSVLFPDGVPPGLMERITATVLSNIYSIAHQKETPLLKSILDGKLVPAHEGNLTVKEVLCWRTAFLVKLGMQTGSGDNFKESIVEVFCGLVDKDSHLCVGSEYMSSGQRRLVTSGKGQEGDGGRKIWLGGYRLVVSAVQKVMAEYGGLEYEKQAFCPTCLAKRSAAEASSWGLSVVRAAAKNGQATITCRHGHRVYTRLVAGPSAALQPQGTLMSNPSSPEMPTTDLLRGVVVVGLWDGNTKKVVRVGSGFVADKKRGLIVTASHTLMNIWGDPNSPFGDNYYGLRQGKVCIGVIPRNKGEETGTEAFFRYFAKIVTKDHDIEKGVCHLDACVLRITTRMENDVGGNGEGCGDQIEHLLLNNPHAIKQEKLQHLKITDKCELDEQVRIVGYNQGGEGLLGPGVSLNRRVDMARGYVCKKFGGGETADVDSNLRHRFKPREEIVVICPTIGGHSGGPCVNQQGEVIGILSRADPAERQRCYLVPTFEWAPLLREAKHIL